MISRERNSNQEPYPRSTTAPSISSPTTRIQAPADDDHLHGFNPNPNPDPDPARLILPPSPQPSTIASVVVRYRECLKNHAANMGTHVVDGCGEFMPSGEDDTPQALKCAACECHRNFHRREVDGESQSAHHQIPLIHNPPPRVASTAPPSQQRSYHHHHPMSPIMMAFGGAAAESSSEDMLRMNGGGMQLMAEKSKKRFRTKFTQEQKEKMHDFAERIGWKIQKKQDEEEVVQFCNEVGLKRRVFKVWMHNNKQATKKS